MAKILLIDDSQLARDLLRNILNRKGYVICGEAANGKVGAEMYRHMKPDLVFCDVMMNEVDGMNCLRTIIAEDPGANVVICTSVGDDIIIGEAAAAGAKEFLVKPIKAEDVLRITEELIGKPGSDTEKSYRNLMEERIVAEGIPMKSLLDFLDAFRQFTGMNLDDPRVNTQYLKENAAGISIGARALLSAKMDTGQADRIVGVFRALV